MTYDLTLDRWIDPSIPFISRAPYTTPRDSVRAALGDVGNSTNAAALALWVNNQSPVWRDFFLGMVNHG